MSVTSTAFVVSCSFVNGVGDCTTIVGPQSQGNQVNAPNTASLSPPLPSASTPASSASPSLTLSLPSSTPPSTSPTAVAPYNAPNTPPSSPHGSSPVTPTGGSSDTNILLTNSLSTIPSSPTQSLHTSTSPVPFLPPSSPSASRLPVGAIAAIGISIGGILLVLVLGIIWYATRRRRQASPAVVSSSSLGSNASLSEAALIAATRHAPLPTEDESYKPEDIAHPSITRSDTRRGSMVAQISNLVPLSRCRDRNPLSRFLETVPFLSAPSVSAKAAREAARAGRTAVAAAAHSPSPWSAEATEGSIQSTTAGMGDGARGQGPRDLWEVHGHGDGVEDGSRSGDGRGTFRYEMDGSVCLDGGPLEEPRYAYADDDQRTSLATVATLPPPYSQY